MVCSNAAESDCALLDLVGKYIIHLCHESDLHCLKRHHEQGQHQHFACQPFICLIVTMNMSAVMLITHAYMHACRQQVCLPYSRFKGVILIIQLCTDMLELVVAIITWGRQWSSRVLKGSYFT